jgi:hypothetical protein
MRNPPFRDTNTVSGLWLVDIFAPQNQWDRFAAAHDYSTAELRRGMAPILATERGVVNQIGYCLLDGCPDPAEAPE